MAPNYLAYHQIDKKKWDQCIDKAVNGSIYGYSFYLDHLTKHWDALVLNDYETVMPLTWNRKYGIYYLYQPPFTPSLGIFGNDLTAGLVKNFLLAVPAKFRYWDIALNEGNFFELEGIDFRQRINYILPLRESYDTLSAQYRENTTRNIKKSEQLQLIIKKNININEVVALAKDQAGNFSKLTPADFEHVSNLYAFLFQKSQATTYGVYTPDNRLIASAAFFLSHHRAYYILVGNHPDGKPLGASHALINAFIRDHAGQELVLDFEGSDIPGLAFFYSSFGALEEKYPAIRMNRLPALLKWMKRN